jgi:hypothetical protein
MNTAPSLYTVTERNDESTSNMDISNPNVSFQMSVQDQSNNAA